MTATTISLSVTWLWWDFDVLQEIKEVGEEVGGRRRMTQIFSDSPSATTWSQDEEFIKKLEGLWMEPLTAHNLV